MSRLVGEILVNPSFRQRLLVLAKEHPEIDRAGANGFDVENGPPALFLIDNRMVVDARRDPVGRVDDEFDTVVAAEALESLPLKIDDELANVRRAFLSGAAAETRPRSY